MLASELQHHEARRVVIVGAGVAGLAAANALLESGRFAPHDVCVLEGSARVGGRVQSRPFSRELSMPVEIGAAWIHGTQSNPFADLAGTFGIKWKEVSPRNPSVHPGSCDGFQLYDGTARLSEEEERGAWVWQDLLLEKLHALASSGDSWATGKPVSEIVDWLVDNDEHLSPLVNGSPNGRKRLEFCLRELEAYFGLTVQGLQVDSFAEIDLFDDSPGPHCMVPAGMERFIDGLVKTVQECIRLNTCVTNIDYTDKDKVVLTTSSGESIEAEYVVVTSSLGYLKSGQLTFDPALPAEKRAAIDRSKMGQYMKVLLHFPHVFWPEDAVFIGQIDDKAKSEGVKRVHFFTFMNHYNVKGYPVLESQLIGDDALQAVASMTDEELALEMFRQVRDTFGSNVPEPIYHLVTRWDQDEWSLGAYSCPTVESTDQDPEILRQSVGKRVFFAGEATNHQYLGTLQAAYITGLQSAEEILATVQQP